MNTKSIERIVRRVVHEYMRDNCSVKMINKMHRVSALPSWTIQYGMTINGNSRIHLMCGVPGATESDAELLLVDLFRQIIERMELPIDFQLKTLDIKKE